ncbi:MAG TPA: helix-turn-helix domain-containing protein [Iamia sp.]
MTAPTPATTTDLLNLKQVAQRLGVHYMTAYRYVRQGLLPARKEGTAWVVEAADVDAFRVGPATNVVPPPDGSTRSEADWSERVRTQLVAGSEAGAWAVVDRALAAGVSPQRCYLELLGGSVAVVGDDVARGEATVADERVATAIAMRVCARLGTRFRRRGRSRGTVVLGAPEGEHHALGVAILSDLIRLSGFAVLELGPDVPAEAFAGAALRAERLVAVGIGVTQVENLDTAAAVTAAVRAVLPDVALVIGGQAVRSPEVAAIVGATTWAPDGEALVAAVEALAPRR